MRSAGLVAIAIVAACHGKPRTTPTPAGDLMGTYRFAREGKTLGHSWRLRSELTLAAPDTYYLDQYITTDEQDHEESETGTFRVEGDKLVLRSRKNESSDFTIRGDSLVAKLDWPGRWFSGKVGGARVFVKIAGR